MDNVLALAHTRVHRSLALYCEFFERPVHLPDFTTLNGAGLR